MSATSKIPMPAGARLAMIVLLAASMMGTLDYRGVTIAVDPIAHTFHTTNAVTQWVILAYTIANAALIIASASLGRRLGQWRMFEVGLAGFVLTSLGCGFAPSLGVLIIMRVVQGACAALMIPQVTVLLFGLAPDNPDRIQAVNTKVSTVTSAASLSILGFLISANIAGLGWRAMFLINVPIGIAAMIGARKIPHKAHHEPYSGGRFDLGGMLLLSAGLAAVVFTVVEGRAAGWPLWSLIMLPAGLLLLLGFWHHQGRRITAGREPLMDTRVFHRPGFAYGVVAMTFLRGSSAAVQLVLTLFLQQYHGWSTTLVGLAFTALALGTIAGAHTIDWTHRRFGAHGVPRLGMIARMVSLLLLGVVGVTGVAHLSEVALFIMGAGQAWMYNDLRVSLLGNRKGPKSVAAGVVETTEFLAGPIWIAVFGLVFFAYSITVGFLASVAFAVAVSIVLELLMILHRRGHARIPADG
ncbi:hypothetical protein BIV57_17955 [Mangrovactinospora gilvigrisea]|uniref:Major facilitator superfamily (MFS) profile domain-containing protein n=1 Tax=Mangrovactinospora gilvigrisea TaxID=1428644 RepID=A0A1J7C910_9ACTN|nr:MFS transporter [Mangrovactinospora gilvigrisea]OIV36122.1 hypothetical protein BIV57_17955 [Mangrovactinospora gilvigrisea]